jgi:O-succinylbenzoate synthase
MRIDGIELYSIKNELITPWTTAYGSDTFNVTVLVKMTSGNLSSWSETSPLVDPTYSPEYSDGVYEIIKRYLIPEVLHKEFDSAEEFCKSYGHIKGNYFAKSALEIAWWTLQAKVTNTPLYKLLGGSYKEIITGGAVGIEPSFDVLIEKIGQLFDMGAPRVKLKMCHGWDLEMLKAVRSTFPNQVFHVDCNSSYSLDELDMFKSIDKYNLAMIEQPLFYLDINDHAVLAKNIETSICLDESITSPFIARQAVEIGACKYINIKPNRVGGLLNSIEINKICKEGGVGCWVGGMIENDVGKGICVDLCTLPNMEYPHDVAPANRRMKNSYVKKALEYSSPFRMLPIENPGELIEPDEMHLKDYIIKTDKFI